MSIWKEISHALNSTLGTAGFKPLDKQIDEVKATNLIKYGSAVKSIQRGVLVQRTSSTTTETSVTISAVTPAKCQVSIFGGWQGHGATATTGNIIKGAHIISLTSTALTVSQGHYSDTTNNMGACSWEIIEYY